MFAQLLLALTLLTSCSALPVTTITPSARPSFAACLVVLGTLTLGVSLLVLVKRVYIHKSRRMIQARQNSILSLPISSTDSVPSHKEKAGFFVGFWGSPTVEIQFALEKTEWKENKQSSFTYQIHTDSRRRRIEYPSVLEINSRLRHSSVSSSRASDKMFVLRESHSFKLPSLPETAHVNSSLPPHSRRFSLPNMNRRMTYDSNRRRHSSLKSARSRRSTISPGSPSSRIASSHGRDTPLPLSPRLSEISATSPTPSSVPAASLFNPKTGSRLSRSFVPPLPPFPFLSSPPSCTERATDLQISHPYALSAHSKKNVQATLSLQADPKLLGQVHRPAPVSAPNVDGITLERSLDQAYSSPRSFCPSPPPDTGILKSKLKVRSRRSPAIGAIGPSPLRSMILPESLDNESSSYKSSQPPHSASASPVDALGLQRRSETNPGITQSGTSNSVPPKARTRRHSVSSHHASKFDDGDSNVSLEGIIRELVEETSEWDQSTVFMNQSFKNLLQESGITPTKSACGSFLLDLDLFKSESLRDVQTPENDNATNLVSFWDEDSGERSNETVGLAW
ncbi:hypothetical protein MSAN_01450800 [Mycena sanguinolenta]|uniref:Uncharacterized protein n=1 Tax=Mycena sanguinolenta TaxID=230812 RepID=A0A8H6YBC5_9AGAR|nr:hypothetical protein MSAN_01450800 [Mycena sanguinolenta]